MWFGLLHSTHFKSIWWRATFLALLALTGFIIWVCISLKQPLVVVADRDCQYSAVVGREWSSQISPVIQILRWRLCMSPSENQRAWLFSRPKGIRHKNKEQKDELRSEKWRESEEHCEIIWASSRVGEKAKANRRLRPGKVGLVFFATNTPEIRVFWWKQK